MKNKFMVRIAAVAMVTFITLSPVNVYAATLIKQGTRGTEVKQVQSTLKELGYFTYPKITGYYGSITKSAVARFQKANGIKTDGIIGKITMEALLQRASLKTEQSISILSTDTDPLEVGENSNNLENADTAGITDISGNTDTTTNTDTPETTDPSNGTNTPIPAPTIDPNHIGALDWFTQVRQIWQRGMIATVTDVNTGRSFQVKRTYGTNHADVETLTKADTQIMKEIWGGFSWQRRAVVVKTGDYIMAGSMTAMPHAGLENKPAGAYVSGRSAGYGYGYNYDSIKGNGINGHMDIHFKNSRTHSTNVMQKVQQDMVKKAAGFIATMNFA